MLSLGMSTNIQTCLEIIVNIWSGPGPGPGPGDFGRTRPRPRPRCFYGPGRSLPLPLGFSGLQQCGDDGAHPYVWESGLSIGEVENFAQKTDS